MQISRRLGPAVALAFGLLGCGENGPSTPPPPPPPPPVPPPLVIAATPTATDTVGAEPVQGLVVEVRDSAGTLLEGASVLFVPTTVMAPQGFPTQSMVVGSTSGGFVGQVSIPTNDRGRAVALVKFGGVAGAAGIEVRVPEFGLIDTVAFTVNAGNAAGIRLAPRDTAVSVGSTLAITGGVIDRFGNTRPDPVTFSAVATPTGAGTVSATGQVTTAGPGSIKVVGTVGAARDSVQVSVVPVGTVAGFNGLTGHFVEINLDGTGRRNITKTPVSPGPDFEPAWSRDGSAIVFTSNGSIAVLDVASGNVSLFPVSPQPYWPTFSVDGQRIYFSVYDGNARIARINRDGSGFEILTTGPWDSRVSFGADPGRFVYHSVGQSGTLQITKYIIGSGQIELMPPFGLFPEWSPLGHQIAYFTHGHELRVMNADGSTDISLTASRYQAQQTSWSPDGKWLLVQGGLGVEMVGVTNDVRGLTLRPSLPPMGGVIWRP